MINGHKYTESIQAHNAVSFLRHDELTIAPHLVRASAAEQDAVVERYDRYLHWSGAVKDTCELDGKVPSGFLDDWRREAADARVPGLAISRAIARLGGVVLILLAFAALMWPWWASVVAVVLLWTITRTPRLDARPSIGPDAAPKWMRTRMTRNPVDSPR